MTAVMTAALTTKSTAIMTAAITTATTSALKAATAVAIEQQWQLQEPELSTVEFQLVFGYMYNRQIYFDFGSFFLAALSNVCWLVGQ